MARKFLTAIDLSKNELQNAAVQNLASAPSSPVKGQLYFDSTGNILYWWNGTAWVSAMGGATTYGNVVTETAFGQASANGVATSVARSDHTHGTPTHLAADHSTIPLSALAPAAADISVGGNEIQNVGTPINSTDAANKSYVDNAIAGLSWKEAVRAATTANITLSAPQTIDGVAVIANERVLVKNQTTTTQNGIYLVAAGAWTRTTDADAVGELEGAAVYVMEGTTLGDTSWSCTTDGPITPGTTATTWAQFAGGGAVTAGAGMTQSGNTLNVVAGDASLTVAADSVIVATDGVTNAKLANMPAVTIKGNNTGSPGDPVDMTQPQLAQIMAGFLARIYSNTIPAGASAVITHNLNAVYVMAQVSRNISPFDVVDCDIERTSVNTLTVRFATAVAANDYAVVVVG